MELKQKIHTFWEFFKSIQVDIEHDLKCGDHEGIEQHLHDCNERLLTICGCVVEFEENDGFFEMTFATHGDKNAQYICALLKKDAPEEMVDNWIINAFRPPLSEKAFHSMFERESKTYQGSDFKIYYEIDEVSKTIPIQVYCEGLLGMEHEQQLRITNLMLELFIGELELEARISSINILDKEIENENVCLLPNFYEDLCDIIISEEWVEYHDPTQIYMAYKIDEKISFEGLRKDMKLILTTHPALQEELLNQECFICKDMKQKGGEYGYIYFEPSQEKEKNALVRQQLEKEIHDLLYPLSVARTIGGAIGTNYAYIDMLIFDKTAFKIALEKMRKHLPFDLYYRAFLTE